MGRTKHHEGHFFKKYEMRVKNLFVPIISLYIMYFHVCTDGLGLRTVTLLLHPTLILDGNQMVAMPLRLFSSLRMTVIKEHSYN